MCIRDSIGGRALGNIIREGKTSMIPSYMQSGSGEGMQTMDQALVALVQAGRITAEDAMTKATDKTVFERLVAGGPGAAIGGIPPIGGPPPGAVPRPGPPPGATPRQPGQSGFPPPQRPPIGRR